jgi:peroxiredoxin
MEFAIMREGVIMLPWRSLAALALAVALAACLQSPPGRPALKAEKDRKAAPHFTLKDATGAAVDLADYQGKVVLLNFWATWCGPCKIEIPWFIDFQQRYKDRDFAVIGVSMDDDGWQSVKPYVAEHKINYRIVIGTEEISQQYGGVEALPTTFILDREGRIASRHVGLVSKSDYQNEIVHLLDAPKQTAGVMPGALVALSGAR